MNPPARSSSRRRFLRSLIGLGAGLIVPAPGPRAGKPVIARAIPSTGERLPVIGMGSWLTFDVDGDPDALAVRVQVLQTFFDRGGALIDSSPMYGSSEETIGYCLRRVKNKGALFAATKVWIFSRQLGITQMEHSRELWGVGRFDLMQVHNMLSWEAHLQTLQDMKAQGRLRYTGITTSHGRRHERMERVLAKQPFDFVQLTYNLLDREAEQRLLPLAAERGIAVIVNRPFRRGALFRRVRGRALPGWAAELDCENWAQFFLKFIISHPAVTCAIPATSRVDHMEQNMEAGRGRLPDAPTRRRMVRYFEDL